MPAARELEKTELDHAVTVGERSSASILRLGDPLRLTSRLALWGTFAGVGTTLAAPAIGHGLITWFVAGAGAIIGGLGTVALSMLILRRRKVRLTWKIGGLLGVPFGLCLGALGVIRLFVMPSIIAPGRRWDLALLYPVLGTVVLVGIVLSLLVGTDVVRFIVRQLVTQDQAPPRS